MKTLIIAALAATAIAGPALAEKSPLQIANEIFAQSHETGDGPRGVPAASTDGISVTTANGGDVFAKARAIFAQSHERGDGARYVPGKADGAVFSTSNGSLFDLANQKLDNDERGDN